MCISLSVVPRKSIILGKKNGSSFVTDAVIYPALKRSSRDLPSDIVLQSIITDFDAFKAVIRAPK